MTANIELVRQIKKERWWLTECICVGEDIYESLLRWFNTDPDFLDYGLDNMLFCIC